MPDVRKRASDVVMNHIFLASAAALLLTAACSSETGPTTPDPGEIVIEPIQVESVEVSGLESFPPQAVARVRGVVGDGCSEIHSREQERSGSTVTVTILRQRPRDAICIQIAKLYDETIRLEGVYPPGPYTLRVNDVVTPFITE